MDTKVAAETPLRAARWRTPHPQCPKGAADRTGNLGSNQALLDKGRDSFKHLRGHFFGSGQPTPPIGWRARSPVEVQWSHGLGAPICDLAYTGSCKLHSRACKDPTGGPATIPTVSTT